MVFFLWGLSYISLLKVCRARFQTRFLFQNQIQVHLGHIVGIKSWAFEHVYPEKGFSIKIFIHSTSRHDGGSDVVVVVVMVVMMRVSKMAKVAMSPVGVDIACRGQISKSAKRCRKRRSDPLPPPRQPSSLEINIIITTTTINNITNITNITTTITSNIILTISPSPGMHAPHRPAPTPGEMAALVRPGPKIFQECPAPPHPENAPGLNCYPAPSIFSLSHPAPAENVFLCPAPPCLEAKKVCPVHPWPSPSLSSSPCSQPPSSPLCQYIPGPCFPPSSINRETRIYLFSSAVHIVLCCLYSTIAQYIVHCTEDHERIILIPDFSLFVPSLGGEKSLCIHVWSIS